MPNPTDNNNNDVTDDTALVTLWMHPVRPVSDYIVMPRRSPPGDPMGRLSSECKKLLSRAIEMQNIAMHNYQVAAVADKLLID